MTGPVASLARLAPAALQRAADALVSVVFWADSLVNQRLTSPWSGWTCTCDPSSDAPRTREDAGNAASQVLPLLSWGEVDERAML